MKAKQNNGRAILLDKIKEEQMKAGYVSEAFIADMSKKLKLSIGDVYGVTTFYSFLSTQPLGRHVIRVCKSVPCCMCDAEMVIDWIRSELEIDPGETSGDGRFSFELCNCIGACDMAPAMLIDDQVYGQLNREKTSEILKSYE
jgi:NADH:ubiquinone oxidoreductase subunit E